MKNFSGRTRRNSRTRTSIRWSQMKAPKQMSLKWPKAITGLASKVPLMLRASTPPKWQISGKQSSPSNLSIEPFHNKQTSKTTCLSALFKTTLIVFASVSHRKSRANKVLIITISTAYPTPKVRCHYTVRCEHVRITTLIFLTFRRLSS